MNISWYVIEGLNSTLLEAVRVEMLKRTFITGSSTGFKVELARTTVLEGLYIEKTEFIEKVSDPFGDVLELKRIKFESTKFRLGNQYPQLEVFDSNKSSKGLIAQISRATGHTIAIEKTEVSLQEWISVLEQYTNARFEVRKIIYSGIEISEGILGQLVVGGNRDIRDDSQKFFGAKTPIIKKACLHAMIGENKTVLEIYRTSRASINKGDLDNIVEQLRSALGMILEKSYNR